MKQWQTNFFQHAAPPDLWSSSFLGSQVYVVGTQVPLGSTVIRTRLQINLTLGVFNNAPPTNENKALDAGGVSVLFGLYCNPAKDTAFIPPPVNFTGSEDGFWIQRNQLTLRAVDNQIYSSTSGVMNAYFACDDGTYNSQGMRGPAEVASAVFLCWNIVGSLSQYWTNNVGAYSGVSAGAIFLKVLTDLTPP